MEGFLCICPSSLNRDLKARYTSPPPIHFSHFFLINRLCLVLKVTKRKSWDLENSTDMEKLGFGKIRENAGERKVK